jgi:hypothetical protein
MSLSFPKTTQFACLVGRTPWSAADALVGWPSLEEESGSRGTRADLGGCPTVLRKN